MTNGLSALLEGLQAAGWTVELKQTPSLTLPEAFRQRYPTLPQDFVEFLSGVKSCVNSTETAWLLCEDDYNGQNEGSAYRWDEFERMSVKAARDDTQWLDEIVDFWTSYLPIGQSLESGYSYLAIDVADAANTVVYGSSPDFDEPMEVCDSFSYLLQVLAGIEAGQPIVETDFPGSGGSEQGGWHRPHPLCLGGAEEQALTPTGETRRWINPQHLDATDLHLRVLKTVKRKMAAGSRS
jgi:hypothetical protein